MTEFVFDRDGVEAVLGDLRRLREDLVADLGIAQRLVEVVGPGDEPASELMANAARSSGKAFQTHNKDLLSFVDRYIVALTASRDQYFHADENGREQFERR